MQLIHVHLLSMSHDMKKKLLSSIIIILALICALSGIHITVDTRQHQTERLLIVTALCSNAYGVSQNIIYTLDVADNTYDDAAIIGTKIYLDRLVDNFMIMNESSYSFKYNYLLWQFAFIEDTDNVYSAITVVRDRFTEIFEKHISGTPPNNADYVFLRGLQSTLYDFYSSLQNEDGSINKKAITKTHLSEKLEILTNAFHALIT